ncbi:hypothetical protein AB0L59_20170 [Streptomyces sp. NPDC052109]|uniref:hypothetical protein n=1 Tax=Streptomyces sp. NPDC052109 TaxID=3155527 RepID=UPI0034241002
MGGKLRLAHASGAGEYLAEDGRPATGYRRVESVRDVAVLKGTDLSRYDTDELWPHHFCPWRGLVDHRVGMNDRDGAVLGKSHRRADDVRVAEGIAGNRQPWAGPGW